MESNKDNYPIWKMAKVLGVTRSGYYKYLNKGPSNRSKEDIILSGKIKNVFKLSRRTYGSPRIVKELKSIGYNCGKNRVARLMKDMDIVPISYKRFKIQTTDSNHSFDISPNLLNRDFRVDKPNRVWVSDITYIATQEGWLYLCVIIDLFSRKIVGWSMQNNLNKSLVISALEMAYMSRKPDKGLLFHSDRGTQYASKKFRNKLNEYKMIQSMSRKGNCWDNACAESFFGTFKTELIYLNKYRTIEDAKRDAFEYIEVFYNRFRRHSTLDYLSPDNYEQKISA